MLAHAGISAEIVCVFGPYTSAAAITENLGFGWSAASETGIASTDTEELVVAVKGDKVVAWAMVPRGSTGTLVRTGFGCGAVPHS